MGIPAEEVLAGPLRLAPKLEMMNNGDTMVNAVRASLGASVSVSDDELRHDNLPADIDQQRAPVTARELTKGEAATPRLAKGPSATFSTFVHVNDDADADLLRAALTKLESIENGHVIQKGTMFAVDLPAADLADIRRGANGWDFVQYIETGDTLKAPTPLRTASGVARPALTERKYTTKSRTHNYGADVLVGIIDVQGFDFAHPDFLDGNHTRWERIWDQRGNGLRPPPAVRAGNDRFGGFGYGSELRRDDMNAALDAASSVGVPATRLEPQSQMVPGSHGTHVASTAAGNRGIARRAALAGVLISLTAEDQDRRSSLYDSTRIAHAVDYLLAVGAELGLPVSINISLGTNGHAHDASSALSRWIDYALAAPGRSVSVAAGNSGQYEPTGPDDFGYVLGRVHTSGRIEGPSLTAELGWNVVGNQVMDISENELEIWYSGQDRLAVEVKPPGGSWIGPIEPGHHIRNMALPDLTMLSVFSEMFHPANGANRIAVYLSPFFAYNADRKVSRVVGIPAGEWRVRITGRQIRDGRYHAWIERDDPRKVGRVGDRDAWSFPSFFSRDTYAAGGTVSSLACGQRVLSVANLNQTLTMVNSSSSRGPTRDDRSKPDLGAVGTAVVAADGFSDAGWIEMDGTSMASPHVAGTAALLLSIDPDLTAAQIGSILRRTSQPLPGDNFDWRPGAGFGAMDPDLAITEATEFLEARRRGVG